MNRRVFLQRSLATGAIAIAASSGLLVPGTVLASWNKAAFEAKDMASAVKGAVGADAMEDSAAIKIKAPDIAENGAVVPITVSTTLKDVESISIFSEKNGTPLVAQFTIEKSTQPFISTRIKMGKTSNVVAVVKSAGKSYQAKKEVKVTIGGCGG